MKRLFWALNIGYNLKEKIGNIIIRLKQNQPNINWVIPENYHITLHFLGDCGHEAEEALKVIMQETKGLFGSIEFELKNFGGFPNLKNPRIVFFSCQQINGGTAYGLYKHLSLKLYKYGFLTDKRIWTPHITLGRIKKPPVYLPDNFSAREEIKFEVDKLDLMESVLKPEGPEYKILQSVRL